MELNFLESTQIALAHNVLTDAECDTLTDFSVWMKNNEFMPKKALENANKDEQNFIEDLSKDRLPREEVNNFWIERNVHLSFAPKIYQKISRKLQLASTKLLRKYLEELNTDKKNFNINDVVFDTVSVYQAETSLNTHSDCDDYALVFWLSEYGKDFEGGELYFTDLDITIKPTKGTLLLQPSKNRHEIKEITSGYRCGMTCFVAVKNQ